MILGRLFYLQIIKSDEAEEAVLRQLSLTEKSPSPRGEIFDRNGVTLATNREGYIVLVKKSDDLSLDVTLENLADISDTSYDELKKELKEQGFSYNNPFVFSENADAKTITKIKESPEKFPCVEILTTPVREYFYPDTAVH
ncbi:MAG: hypothetical protein IJB50_03565, partial [Clostridia bacterium]|nr:hypothetical protein [Clostridia bacterium]